MKATFNRLPEEKRMRVIEGCIDEFGEYGYDKGSTDRIIKRCGISKGGLYEYTNSKEDLYLFIVDYCYTQLYDYINTEIRKKGKKIPEDILERFQLASGIAIEYYLSHPKVIEFIVKSNSITEPEMEKKVQSIFLKQFFDLFGNIKTDNLIFDKEHILDLLRWLLLKTRNDFLIEISKKRDPAEVKEAYFKDWEFFTEILRNGIYKKTNG